MTKSKAISLTLANRKPQREVVIPKLERKVRLGDIESLQGDYKLIDGGQLMVNYAKGWKGSFWKWNK